LDQKEYITTKFSMAKELAELYTRKMPINAIKMPQRKCMVWNEEENDCNINVNAKELNKLK